MNVNLVTLKKDNRSIDLVNDTITNLGFDVILKKIVNYDPYIKNTFSNIFDYFSYDLIEIKRREVIFKDFLNQEKEFKCFYALLSDNCNYIESKFIGIIENSPSSVVSSSTFLLEKILIVINELVDFINITKDKIVSKDLKELFQYVNSNFNENYIMQLGLIIEKFKFKHGMFVSGNLDNNMDLADFEIFDQETDLKERMKWKFSEKIILTQNDDRVVKEYIRQTDMALLKYANKLARLTKDLLEFLKDLRFQFSFYIGGLNLALAIKEKKKEIIFPRIIEGNNYLEFNGLYDLSLLLNINNEVVCNDFDLSNKLVIIITGANQGGKTTFIRSIGQAYILSQMGFNVNADSFHFSLKANVFTHFNKEEDKEMKSGKLDEELGRLSKIVDLITPNSLMLFNESFSSTYEKDASKISFDVLKAFKEKNITSYFVTHLYELSNILKEQQLDNTIFLRANRSNDGTRMFRLAIGESLQTSFASDLYLKIFKE